MCSLVKKEQTIKLRIIHIIAKYHHRNNNILCMVMSLTINHIYILTNHIEIIHCQMDLNIEKRENSLDYGGSFDSNDSQHKN